MAAHSSILVWEIPWTEEPGGPQSMESQRVGHNEQLTLSLLGGTDWRTFRGKDKEQIFVEPSYVSDP